MEQDKKNTNKMLVFTFISFGAAYLLTLSARPYELSYLVKAVPIFCLVLFALVNIPGKIGKLTALGLLFSSFGDIFLALRSVVTFAAGMLAFMIAHLFYIAVFLREPVLTAMRGFALGMIVLFSLAYALFLYPHMGFATIPIYSYFAVISVMGICACLGRRNHPLVVLGAYLFIVSDAIIAYNMFFSRVHQSSLWIMTTYYLAQVCIAYGVYLSYKDHRFPIKTVDGS